MLKDPSLLFLPSLPILQFPVRQILFTMIRCHYKSMRVFVSIRQGPGKVQSISYGLLIHIEGIWPFMHSLPTALPISCAPWQRTTQQSYCYTGGFCQETKSVSSTSIKISTLAAAEILKTTVFWEDERTLKATDDNSPSKRRTELGNSRKAEEINVATTDAKPTN